MHAVKIVFLNGFLHFTTVVNYKGLFRFPSIYKVRNAHLASSQHRGARASEERTQAGARSAQRERSCLGRMWGHLDDLKVSLLNLSSEMLLGNDGLDRRRRCEEDHIALQKAALRHVATEKLTGAPLNRCQRKTFSGGGQRTTSRP